jgi:hypothetical protein
MSATKYIRPMSFGQTINSMYRMYLRIMIPILLLNGLLVLMSWWVLFVGAFVGPVLLMTSNAILDKPLKVLSSFWKGVFSFAFLKIALSSIIYIIFIILLFGVPSSLLTNDTNQAITITIFAYIILLPIWIFIPIIMLLEKKGLRASTKRSFQILRKNFSRILKMDIFIIVVIAVMTSILSAIFGGGSENFAMSTFFALGLFLFTGFSSLPYVLVYYEYRARYENYSEELLTQEMGYQPMEEMMNV